MTGTRWNVTLGFINTMEQERSSERNERGWTEHNFYELDYCIRSCNTLRFKTFCLKEHWAIVPDTSTKDGHTNFDRSSKNQLVY